MNRLPETTHSQTHVLPSGVSGLITVLLRWMRPVTLCMLLPTLCFQPLAAAEYDVVITNGRVMDPETGFDAVRNVGIRDGLIVVITEVDISGVEMIDASDHVVSAGFIDTHAHSHGNPWGVKAALRDGVTTLLDLEYGNINVDQWYREREGRWPINHGAAASHEMHRMRVLDGLTFDAGADAQQGIVSRAESYLRDGIPNWAETVPSLAQLNEILVGLDEELRAGAIAVASTMGYMAKGATTLEVLSLQRAAAAYGRTSGIHVRLLGNNQPPYEGTLGVLEQLANAAALGAPALISHNNNVGWWEVEDRAQGLRRRGLNVWSEYYPYVCGSSTIGTEYLKPEGMKMLGWDYSQLKIPSTGEALTLESYERLVAQDPGMIIIGCIPEREDWLAKWLRVPHMTVAGDQMPPVNAAGEPLGWDDPWEAYVGHPRTAGTHAKTLRLARELRVPLMHMLAQNSYWSAAHLGDAGLEAMRKRGRMQVGMIADIAIFDPETVTDNATYEPGKNGLPSTGIPWVLVNGTIVVEDSRVLSDRYPGQPIRYPIEARGRFEPIDMDRYMERLLIPR